MNKAARFLELSILGVCAFVLTQALLPLLLTAGDTPVEGNPVWKLILAICYLGVAVILAAHHRETILAVRRNWFLVALVVLAVFSCLWAQMPTLVLQRSIALVGTAFLGIALAVRVTVDEQLKLMSWVFRAIALLSLACIILLPKAGVAHGFHMGDWQGVFNQKNGLGTYMALSVLVEWHVPTSTLFAKIFNVFALLLAAVLLVFSNSMTALITLVATLIFIQLYKLLRLRVRVPFIVIVSLNVAAMAFGAALVLLNGDTATAALGRSSSLTGRTEIWQSVIPLVLQRPILGFGYSGFWGGASSESLELNRRFGQMIMHSHDGYIDMLLTLGIIGLLLVLAFLGTGIKRAIALSERYESSADLWPLAFLFFFMFHNLAECTIMWPNNLEWALCIATIVGADVWSLADETEESVLVPSEEFT